MGLAYSFRDLVHDHLNGKHGDLQADVEQEKELGVLHLDPQVTGSELCSTLGVA